jgi:hypothetical protein
MYNPIPVWLSPRGDKHGITYSNELECILQLDATTDALARAPPSQGLALAGRLAVVRRRVLSGALD